MHRRTPIVTPSETSPPLIPRLSNGLSPSTAAAVALPPALAWTVLHLCVLLLQLVSLDQESVAIEDNHIDNLTPYTAIVGTLVHS
jgi:hypothetical protein